MSRHAAATVLDIGIVKAPPIAERQRARPTLGAATTASGHTPLPLNARHRAQRATRHYRR